MICSRCVSFKLQCFSTRQALVVTFTSSILPSHKSGSTWTNASFADAFQKFKELDGIILPTRENIWAKRWLCRHSGLRQYRTDCGWGERLCTVTHRQIFCSACGHFHDAHIFMIPLFLTPSLFFLINYRCLYSTMSYFGCTRIECIDTTETMPFVRPEYIARPSSSPVVV
jgi:hypothetical protein